MTPDPLVTVTEADIAQALRELREEAHGHEPYAPGVYPRARSIAAARATRSLEATFDNQRAITAQESMEDHHHWEKG